LWFDSTVSMQHECAPLNLRVELEEHGYVLLREAGAGGLVRAIEELGRVLQVEEVVVSSESASLVRSERGLSLHTDHHRAEVIVWHCIAQSNAGGETILTDALAALSTLTPSEQAALSRIELKEHSVFRDDDERHPMLSFRHGRPRVCYSYWMATELGEAERAAFDAFARAVEHAPRITLRLAPGDVLAIDSCKMLHGRLPIDGSKERHLRRYWLEAAPA